MPKRQVCPKHGIPDCSPLLNGCLWKPDDVTDAHRSRPGPCLCRDCAMTDAHTLGAQQTTFTPNMETAYSLGYRQAMRDAKNSDVDGAFREGAAQERARIKQKIEAWIRHGEAVPADVTTYERWIVHDEIRRFVDPAFIDKGGEHE